MLHALAGLEPEILLQDDSSAVVLADLLEVLGHCEFVVLDIRLLKQTEILEFLVQAADDHLVDNVLGLAGVLIHGLLLQDRPLLLDEILINILAADVQRLKSCDLHSDVLKSFLDLIVHDLGVSLYKHRDTSAAVKIRDYTAVLSGKLLETADRKLLADNRNLFGKLLSDSELRIKLPRLFQKSFDVGCLGLEELISDCLDIVLEFLVLGNKIAIFKSQHPSKMLRFIMNITMA